MSFVLGLTGPTGAGKGVFSGVAKEFGFKVIDCDLKARKAVKKGMPGLSALVSAFGESILLESGELDRGKLASVVFSSRENTELLNSTLLPYIRELVEKEISGDLVLLDAPTLFESGIDAVCDKTVAVLADVEKRKKRIMERDRLSVSAADNRISAGKDDEFYTDRVDIVIKNDGDLKIFVKKVRIYLNDIVGGALYE